ncbi:hypothetical protein [Bacillus atrophaeus]|uniref:hypothetical protein n=1 Tax=Bacillus atrophaeus TaxID=1452 RepID=UPI000330C56E|nr:hypothetical protein [Bacillus atrophaeus]AKL83833.1 hypothetical protein D068_cds11020 [Bacillus atrophaeus UCMB-5137]MBJ7896025.1 hypothetical protein [Bacillus atrophaeus]MED1015535.1 hypothetical protein [Bacillus atrophaeus]MED1131176.1 hypothetical protein [Bacillus atrophaeus]
MKLTAAAMQLEAAIKTGNSKAEYRAKFYNDKALTVQPAENISMFTVFNGGSSRLFLKA